jgi:cell division protein FtsI/penicillin-binding protein 2
MGLWRSLALAAVFHLIHRAETASAALCSSVAQLSRRAGLRHVPGVRITCQLISPAVAGFIRPVILIPAGALAGLTPRELDFILAHECAHIRRQDFLWGLLQAAAETLLFFHPAVWWVSRRMNHEKELACDDLALQITGHRREGASALARLAELQLSQHPSLAPSATGGHLLLRIRRLLDPAKPSLRPSALAIVPLLAATSLLPFLIFQKAESQDSAAASSPIVKTILQRGSITDRNGVILAESVPGEWTHNGKPIAGLKRRYPLGALVSHVIGYTRNNAAEKTEDTGIAGMEKTADSLLAHVMSPEGHPQPAVALTIDAKIQQLCRSALLDAGVGRGCAVMLDVTNGDILAMVSLPDYDPGQFSPFITAEIWDPMQSDRTTPLWNRALSAFPPGSTFKLVTALASGESDLWKSEFECTGSVTYATRRFECWRINGRASRHGKLALSEAVQRSCNCYFYQLGNATGADRIAAMAGKLGIGARSTLTPDIQPGFVPDQTWWAGQKYGGPWTDAKTANVAIGQGEVQATPLQMAGVAATIANGGKVWQPRLISRNLVAGQWQVQAPEFCHDLIHEGISPEALQALRAAMTDVVQADGATGKVAQSDLIRIAGKTGTAQKWRIEHQPPDEGKQIPDHITWFIGFAPAAAPRYAFAICVANGKSGGSICAPIAKRILESVQKLNAGTLTVELKAESPAKGHFNFLDSVQY